MLHPIRHPFQAPNGVKSLWHISYKRPKTWLYKVYGKTHKIYVFYDFPRVIKHINLHSVNAHAQYKRDPNTRNEIARENFGKKAHKQRLPQPATKSFDGEIERFLCFNQQIIIIFLPTPFQCHWFAQFSNRMLQNVHRKNMKANAIIIHI